jgi:hypothetical protein
VNGFDQSVAIYSLELDLVGKLFFFQNDNLLFSFSFFCFQKKEEFENVLSS